MTTFSAVLPALPKAMVNVTDSPGVTSVGVTVLLIHTSATGDIAMAHST